MRGIYHALGLWRALFRQPLWHVRECMRNPAYRALHRFHGRLRKLPRFTPAEVAFAGRSIRLCDNASFLSAWDEVFVNRIYDIVPRDGSVPCLVDAGANIGLAALFWKWKFGQFRYIGFEPDPMVAACARHNLATWGIDGEIVQAAVGAKDGIAAFQRDYADGGRLNADRSSSRAEMIKVEVTRLSAHLPPDVDLLKIDVEGAEGEVLTEISPCLDRVRALFVEWHSVLGVQGMGNALAQLEAAGFSCFVQAAVGPPRPFLERAVLNGFTQQLNIYAIRS